AAVAVDDVGAGEVRRDRFVHADLDLPLPLDAEADELTTDSQKRDHDRGGRDGRAQLEGIVPRLALRARGRGARWKIRANELESRHRYLPLLPPAGCSAD